MFAAVTPGSGIALALLGLCFLLVLLFEFSNGFHDTANAVATVIYTKSLPAAAAVVWSGLMNFLGVLTGGIAVAYALVSILPPEVLSPPDGNPALGMLAALFLTSLLWNVGTWWLAIPNSSSHALIGSLIGVSASAALVQHRPLGQAVDWGQIVHVIEALLFSPLLGFGLALILFRIVRRLFRDPHLYRPPEGDRPPVWWLRGILVATCTAVSFAHGSNDGQKSIGLIMLTLVGIAPFAFAINPQVAAGQLAPLAARAEAARVLIVRAGGDPLHDGAAAAADLARTLRRMPDLAALPGRERVRLRADVNAADAELKRVGQLAATPKPVRAAAERLRGQLGTLVDYAPWWVRLLSALCLGLGTTIGYRRIVTTLGERLGKQHLAPAQGAVAELVAAGVIGVAGFTGGPVSTTHVLTSGIAGTMVGSGAGVEPATMRRIALAWVLTLPVTILLSGLLFRLFS